MKNLVTLGSVSHASLRTEDLIPRFIKALDIIKDNLAAPGPTKEPPEETQQRVQLVGALDSYLGSLERRIAEPGYYESERANYDLEELQEHLNYYTPPFVAFGPHEGNSSDFGFWVDWNAVNNALADGNLRKYPAGCNWPKLPKEVEYVLEVNDHGNCTLYDRDHTKLWSCV
jgi:hypothetical protein